MTELYLSVTARSGSGDASFACRGPEAQKSGVPGTVAPIWALAAKEILLLPSYRSSLFGLNPLPGLALRPFPLPSLMPAILDRA